MNTIARLLVQGGEDHADTCFPGIYFRQSLPVASAVINTDGICTQFCNRMFQNMYDLVICAFTLFELPSQNERLKLLLNLWQKTDGYLVGLSNFIKFCNLINFR
jgi:hypothetical protein